MFKTNSSVSTATRLSGPDSSRFLQGQLTCDVSSIGPGQWTWAAACTPKGRVIDVFRLFRLEQDSQGHDAFLLLCWSADAAERLLTHLGKYKVFFKCEFSPCDIQSRGVFLSAVPAADSRVDAEGVRWPASSNQVRQDSRSGIRLRATEAVEARFDIALLLGEGATDEFGALADDEFSALQALFGVPMLDADTSGKFTAHALGLPSFGAVNFGKGCFTGQEIVARTQYLGSSRKQPVAFGVLAKGTQTGDLPASRFVCASEDDLDAILVKTGANVVIRVRPESVTDGIPAAANSKDRLPFSSACLAVLDPEKI